MRRTLFSLCVLLAACTRTGAPSSGGLATVDHVVDGDTAVVRLNGREETVRLLGVDTPETVDPDTPPECFGPEASDHTKALLPPGTEVRLTRDVEARDRYDRLLVYVERADDGLFVNLDLVEGGWADDLPYPPNTAHSRRFALAVATARREGRGLWGACGNADTPAG
jgi:micrococcal nuclease